MLKLNLILNINAKKIPIIRGINKTMYWLKFIFRKIFLTKSSIKIDKIPITQYFKNNLYLLGISKSNFNILIKSKNNFIDRNKLFFRVFLKSVLKLNS